MTTNENKDDADDNNNIIKTHSVRLSGTVLPTPDHYEMYFFFAVKFFIKN